MRRRPRAPHGAAEFEATWRADPDPWSFETSSYERRKYDRTLAACGTGPFSRALELGGANGVFSVRLAPRCERLTTLDVSPTAVHLARARLAAAGLHDVRVRVGAVPDDLPDGVGDHDLVVASEILYYLDRPALDRALDGIARLLRPGGRLVAVHWTPEAPDHVLPGRVPHEVLAGRAELAPVDHVVAPTYLLDAYDRR